MSSREYRVDLGEEGTVLQFASKQLQELLATSSVKQKPEHCYLATWPQLKLKDSRLADKLDAYFNQADCTELFVLLREDSRLYIIGECERAVLYGVYQFGEQYLGLNWIYPNQQAVFIQPETDFYSLELQSYKPIMERRGFVFETIDDVPFMQGMVDWLAKNKINEIFFTFTLWDKIGKQLQSMIVERGIGITLGGHSMKFFLDRQAAENAFQANHPYTARTQLNYRDDSWQGSILDDISEYCKYVSNLERISLWPEDVKNQQSEQFLTDYIGFTERLQANLEQAGLQIEVEHIAYNAGLAWDMLERNNQVNSSVIDTLYAYWGRDYRYSISDQNSADAIRSYNALQDWVVATKQNSRKLTIFEYYSDHFMLSPLFPMLTERIVKDIHEYASLGIKHMNNLVVPCPRVENYNWQWNQVHNSYVFARACWGEEIEQIKQQFFAYYNLQIREQVQGLYQQLEQVVSVLTSWNVPLFPARAVDPLKAIAAKEDVAKIVAQLEQIIELADQMLALEQIDHYEELKALALHYKSYSELTKQAWEENDSQ